MFEWPIPPDVWNKLESGTPKRGKLPYRLMVDRLREKLKHTRNTKTREVIETDIIVLLGIIEIQDKLDDIASKMLDRKV